MENNPGDSSSESDISDPWSIIDRDSCEPGEISGESVGGEPSDGESLEVIDEDKPDDFKDADNETDGISIISESEINDELEQSIPLVVTKDKKYQHHPNTYLNNRLNVLLVISFAAVTGLGFGHFLGLQEECPISNDSVSLIEKLQNENELLRNQLSKIMRETESSSISRSALHMECEVGTSIKSEASYIYPSSQDDVVKQYLHATDIPNIISLEMDIVVPEQSLKDNEDPFIEIDSIEAQPCRQGEDNSIQENMQYDKTERHSEHFTNLRENAKSDYLHDKNHLGYVSDLNIEIPIITDSDQTTLPKDLKDEKSMESLFISGDNLQSNEYINEDIVRLENVIESVVNKYSHNLKSNDHKESHIDLDLKGDETIVDNPNIQYEYDSNKKILVENDINLDEGNVKHEYNSDKKSVNENNLNLIKTSLNLLKTYLDYDIMSHESHDVVVSAFQLVKELEENLYQLQTIINDCKVQTTEFCLQFQKKMITSMQKLRETTNGLVDDIGEQMYKLLTKIVRKLKKYKGNLQEKWCHITKKYNGENDKIHNWFQNTVMLDCNKKDKQKSNQKTNKNIKKSSEDKQNVETLIKQSTDTKEYQFKLDKQNIPYRVENEKFIDTSEKLKDFQADNPSDKLIFNHDNPEDMHLKVPDTVPESLSYTGQEPIMTKYQKDWKYVTKKSFNNKDKRNYKNNNIKKEYNSRNCDGLTSNDESCSYKNDKIPQSKKFKEQYIKRGRGDNYWYEKKNSKNHFSNKERKEHKKETKYNWQGENKYDKQSVIIGEGSTWTLMNADNNKKNNISGDWVLKMSNGRADYRKLERKSDWMFDRADARKMKRERSYINGNWYFQRVRGREYCRYYPHSDWCKIENYNSANYYPTHQNNYHKQYYEEKRRHLPRWSKKFIPRTFAAAGKWMKDSITDFQNKINYYSHH